MAIKRKLAYSCEEKTLIYGRKVTCKPIKSGSYNNENNENPMKRNILQPK